MGEYPRNEYPQNADNAFIEQEQALAGSYMEQGYDEATSHYYAQVYLYTQAYMQQGYNQAEAQNFAQQYVQYQQNLAHQGTALASQAEPLDSQTSTLGGGTDFRDGYSTEIASFGGNAEPAPQLDSPSQSSSEYQNTAPSDGFTYQNEIPSYEAVADPSPTPAPAAQGIGNYPMSPPARMLTANRGLLKYILLSFVTFGIYSLIALVKISDEVNLTAVRDGKKTMNFALGIFLVFPLTSFIYSFVWWHGICNRIGEQLTRRRIAYSFASTDYWLWSVLGSFIIVGPFVFLHKFFKAQNLVNAHYNQCGM